MEDNHLEEALIAIRRVMRATEINSLSLAKKSQLTPTQHIVLQIIANKKGILKITNTNLIEDSKKNFIVMGRNTQLSIEDENGLQVAVYKVPYGSKLFFQNGDKDKKGSKIQYF